MQENVPLQWKKIPSKQENFAPVVQLNFSVHVLRGVTSLVPWTTKGSEYFIAFHLLCYLLNHAGHYVSRISLIEHLWNTNQYIDDNTLSVNVTTIREKLSRLGLSGFIQTKRGMGYKV